ncbi:cytochrome P450 [Pleomassaria siparia CBS 279.74]|uniref:Cytochrome P450 n=1 Tax=Pleomassaria siparia CBS 279.74 TaxID=1314801 RepID=A0A6G1JZI1_9PLEO|nr:cytochrome P450 [Pleomassaria siparia CBS 279.74]
MEQPSYTASASMPNSAATAPRVLPSLPILLLCAVFVYIASVCVYRLRFHPLSKYPGPRLAAITDLAFAYYFLRGTAVDWIDEQHRRYGPIVRLGPMRLGYTSPEAVKDIVGHQTGNHKANRRNLLFSQPNSMFDGHNSVFNEENDILHRQQRKLFTNAFSDRALSAQESMIQNYVDKLVALMRKSAGAPRDAVKLWNFATFDIMADLAFGESLGNLEGDEYHPWVASMFAGFKLGVMISYLQHWPGMSLLLDLITPKSAKEEAMVHVANSNNSLTKRLERTDVERPDIWGLVLEKQKKGDAQMSRGSMNANSNIFMMAGTETTATALCGLTCLLLKNPDKMKKLVDEVRAVPSKEELNGLKMRHLKYLGAVIEEGLRVYPAVPAANLRDIAPGGNVIMGDHLPEKTVVGISHWSAFHSPLNFHNPDAFVPERWILDDEEYKEYHDFDKRHGFKPFSDGPRNCLGKNLAYYELRALLAHAVWHFDFELCPESENWLQGQKTWQLWDKPELMIRIKERSYE